MRTVNRGTCSLRCLLFFLLPRFFLLGNAASSYWWNYSVAVFLCNLAYQQTLLEDRVEFRVGRAAAGDDFLVSPYNHVFVKNGFDGNPVGIFFNAPGMTAYPNDTWGARVKVRPTARTYVMGGVYNGDPSIRANTHHGLDFSMDGPLFAIGEVEYQL